MPPVESAGLAELVGLEAFTGGRCPPTRARFKLSAARLAAPG